MRPKCFVSIAECWMLRKQTQQSLKQLKLISLLKLSSAERYRRQCACVCLCLLESGVDGV